MEQVKARVVEAVATAQHPEKRTEEEAETEAEEVFFR